MANTLIEKLTDIKTAKDNLKTALEGMGLNPGNNFSSYASFAQEQLQPAGSGVKLFSSVEEMLNDTTSKEGDLAIVYNNQAENININSEFQLAIFPETVVLTSAVTESKSAYFNVITDSEYVDVSVYANISSTSFSFNYDNMMGGDRVNINYTSEDGITYTRTDDTGNPVKFGYPLKPSSSSYNDIFSNFIKIIPYDFLGLYEYKLKGQYGVPYNFRVDNNKLLYDIIPLDIPSFAKSIGVNTKSGTLIIMKRNEDGDFIGYYSSNSSGQSIVKYNGKLYYANSYAASCYYTDLSTGEQTELTNGQQVTVGSLTTNIMLDTEMEDNDKLVYFIPSGNWNYNVYVETYKLLQPSGGFRYPSYYFADTQLTVAGSDDILPGKIGYGKKGVVIGNEDLYSHISATSIINHVNDDNIYYNTVLKKVISTNGNTYLNYKKQEEITYDSALSKMYHLKGLDTNKSYVHNRLIAYSITTNTENSYDIELYRANLNNLTYEYVNTIKVNSSSSDKLYVTSDLFGNIMVVDKSTSPYNVTHINTENVKNEFTLNDLNTSYTELFKNTIYFVTPASSNGTGKITKINCDTRETEVIYTGNFSTSHDTGLKQADKYILVEFKKSTSHTIVSVNMETGDVQSASITTNSMSNDFASIIGIDGQAYLYDMYPYSNTWNGRIYKLTNNSLNLIYDGDSMFGSNTAYSGTILYIDSSKVIYISGKDLRMYDISANKYYTGNILTYYSTYDTFRLYNDNKIYAIYETPVGYSLIVVDFAYTYDTGICLFNTNDNINYLLDVNEHSNILSTSPMSQVEYDTAVSTSDDILGTTTE